MKNLAIIPARGGSKRIPGKNIRDFFGKPVIAYPISAALSSGCFDEVMVSTDDEAIASIAKEYGASVPFMRSMENAGDHSSTPDVINEVLEQYRKEGKVFDTFCCIYPTAPFVTPQKLQQAYDQLSALQVDSVITITRFGYPILRSFVQDDKGMIAMKWPENLYKRSQDMESFYHDAGQFYLCRTKSFIDQQKIVTGATYGLEIDEHEVQDIDNEQDWKLAEVKYAMLNNIK